ncbi:MAG TPA: hypothetical protein VGG38_06900 [Acidimicrobiales bacterium]
MSDEPRTGLSKLRLSAARGDRRLLKGYGPLAVLLVAFVLMAVLVPTVAPTQDVVHETQTQTGGTGTGGTGTGGTGNGGTTGTTTPGTNTVGGTGTGGGSTGTATTVPQGAKVGGCPGGQTLQVPGDPYSPPCMTFSGSNGGATSPGVTGTQINITYRVPQDSESFQQTLQQIGGADISDTTADIERTITALATYFDNHFQFYGRKLNIEYFTGQGSETNELLGTGQQQADADAVTAAQQLHAFAELNGTTEPYDVALAGQHVVSFGAPYLSAAFMGQYAPYMWSIDPECNDIAQTTFDFALKDIAGGKAAYAGGSLQGQTRKIAAIAPSNPWYQECATEGAQEAQAAGYPLTADIQYTLNLSTESSQAATIISELQNDGVTTVICGCDPVMPVFLTSRAEEQGYTPEWVVAGTAFTDTDIVGQLFQQNEWSHAFGVTFNGPIIAKTSTFGYSAYKQVNPSTEPANAVDAIYEQMYEMALGIQMAGPDLTPQNMETGFRNYKMPNPGATNALYGTWAFPTGHFSPQSSYAIIYWDPNKISPYNGEQGAYTIASQYYPTNTYPAPPVPLPANFPITPQQAS